MHHTFNIPISVSWTRVKDEAAFRDASLRYTITDAPGGQPVTRGRLLAEPDIDLSHYTFKAGIDWLAVRVSFPSERSWREVRATINPVVKEPGKGGVFVYGPDWEENYTGEEFIIRMNDPTRDRVNRMWLALWSKVRPPHKLVPQHRVVALEVFVDIFPKKRNGDTDRDLWARRAMMSDLLRKHVIFDRSWLKDEAFGEKDDWPRFVASYEKSNTEKPLTKTQHLIRARQGPPPALSKRMDELCWWARDAKHHIEVPLNATMYFGGEHRPLMIRLQDKVQDLRKVETAIDLKPEQRRSRIEVQMKNTPELNILGGEGIETIDDLRTYKFKRLRKAFFAFQMPTLEKTAEGGPTEAEVEIMKLTGSLGLDLHQRGSWDYAEITGSATCQEDGPGRLARKGYGTRFTSLNKKVVLALNKLTW